MARAAFSLEIDGFKAMKRRFNAMEELDAPEILTRLDRIARLAQAEVSREAPSSMAGRVTTKPAKKLGGNITLGEVRHPGAKAMEFGRTNYYRGYRGRNQKSGTKFKSSPGQKPRPFVGIIKGDHAMGRLVEPVRTELIAGILDVWNRPQSDS